MGNSLAMNSLGWCYYRGNGVEQDFVEAVKWFRNAADRGNVRAMNNLGWCYYRGEGVEQDFVEAVKWWRNAADRGDVNTMNNLGLCYFCGNGVEKNFEEAVKWFRNAADRGNAAAMRNLGLCYLRGNGVKKDADTGLWWYRRSARYEEGSRDNVVRVSVQEGGHEDSEKVLTELMKQERELERDRWDQATRSPSGCMQNNEAIQLFRDMGFRESTSRAMAEEFERHMRHRTGNAQW